MKTTIVTFAALAASLFFSPGNASATQDELAVMLSPCGSSIGVCAPGIAVTSGSGSICETTSWGDSIEGGTQTACANFEDGSGSWYIAEWGESYFVSDAGSASADGTIINLSYDYISAKL